MNKINDLQSWCTTTITIVAFVFLLPAFGVYLVAGLCNAVQLVDYSTVILSASSLAIALFSYINVALLIITAVMEMKE